MAWMNGMYSSVVAWNNVKPTINSVYKNELGRYSWSNSEFVDEFDLMCLYEIYAQKLVACKGGVYN